MRKDPVTKGQPHDHPGVSPVMLTKLEPHRDAVIAEWHRTGLIETGEHHGLCAASLRLILLHWLGAEVYERQAYLHRVHLGKAVASDMRVWPTIVPRTHIRRWPEFSPKEQDSLLKKVHGWLNPEARILERLTCQPDWEVSAL